MTDNQTDNQTDYQTGSVTRPLNCVTESSASKRPSRKLLLALGIFALISLSFSRVDANSRLTLSNPEFDFGFVPTNCDVTYLYWLHSTGSSDLNIEWTDASCPCAQMPLAEKTIKPGDSVALELIFTSGRVAGAVTRKPYIKTNADSEPQRVEFVAKVLPGKIELAKPLGIKPFRADLSSIGPYHRDTAKIVLFNNSENSMDISLVYSAQEFFEVILPESIESGESDTCVVILNRESPEAVGAAFAKSFTIEVAQRIVGDNSLKSRFSIPVRRKYSPNK